ncbi:hypothetical protein ACFE04_025376 [Oxalis oulophora]
MASQNVEEQLEGSLLIGYSSFSIVNCLQVFLFRNFLLIDSICVTVLFTLFIDNGIAVTSILITSNEKETSSLTRQFIPNASEILYENDIFEIKYRQSNSPLNIFTGWGSLVTDICDTTSIADTVSSSPPPPLSQSPSPVRITAIAKAEAKGLNGIFFSSSLAIFKPSYATRGVDSFLERAADEGLMILTSPRMAVGKFYIDHKVSTRSLSIIGLDLYYINDDDHHLGRKSCLSQEQMSRMSPAELANIQQQICKCSSRWPGSPPIRSQPVPSSVAALNE